MVTKKTYMRAKKGRNSPADAHHREGHWKSRQKGNQTASESCNFFLIKMLEKRDCSNEEAEKPKSKSANQKKIKAPA